MRKGKMLVISLLSVLLVSTPVLAKNSKPKASANPPASRGEVLRGTFGASDHWGSGWLDLKSSKDFKKGDTLRIKVGGTAKKILVRLLARGEDPNLPVGILGAAREVPGNRTVEVKLDSDYKDIVQISVHGGPNPWGQFPLGGGNGPATIESVELVR